MTAWIGAESAAYGTYRLDSANASLTWITDSAANEQAYFDEESAAARQSAGDLLAVAKARVDDAIGTADSAASSYFGDVLSAHNGASRPSRR